MPRAATRDRIPIEDVPEGYQVRYENKGAHAEETDRCYNGGTILNYRIPKTGDSAPVETVLLGIGLAGLLGAGAYALRRKRRKPDS